MYTLGFTSSIWQTSLISRNLLASIPSLRVFNLLYRLNNIIREFWQVQLFFSFCPFWCIIVLWAQIRRPFSCAQHRQQGESGKVRRIKMMREMKRVQISGQSIELASDATSWFLHNLFAHYFPVILRANSIIILPVKMWNLDIIWSFEAVTLDAIVHRFFF